MGIPKGGIGFFDSGIGGLTVLSACAEKLKGENFYYLGDNKRAPYGNLTPKRIQKYVDRAFRVFARLHVQAVVIACNTATAVCIESLRKKYTFPIIGMEPAVFPAMKKGENVLVLTTVATYRSKRFQNLCGEARRKYPNTKLTEIACPDLAGGIEKKIGEQGIDWGRILPEYSPDVVVLGCTHYIYIKKDIARYYGCEVIDGNVGVANQLKRVLKKNKKKNTKWLKKKKIRRKTNRIFFLGSRKAYNKHVYEQMFALKRSKMGRKWSSIPKN